MTISEINMRSIELWQKYYYSNLIPQLYNENLIINSEGSVLFIGLNPSFSKIGFSKFLEGTQYENLIENIYEYYKINNFKSEKLEVYNSIQNISKQRYSYYEPFRQISRYLNLKWEHIDLFLMMETKQINLKKLYKRAYSDRINDYDLRIFFDTQKEIFLDLISLLNPKLIIVPNAFASDLIRDILNLNFDNQIGTYLYGLTPIFLSSQFTGGATDKYSFERFKWHIKSVLKE